MTTSTMSTGARLAVVLPGVAVAVALGLVAVTIGPALPARVATHFGPDGTADGWASPWTFFWPTAVVAVGAVVLASAALRLSDRRTLATLLLVANALATPLAVAWIGIAVTNTSSGRGMSWWWIVLTFAALVAVVTPPTIALVRAAGPVPTHDVDPLAVRPGTRVAWRARIGSRWLAALGAAVVLAGVWATWTVAPDSPATAVVTGGLLLLAGLGVIALARVECTVDRRGLRLTSAWTRIPIMRVPLDRIESCGWEDVSPGQWGGWGYRVSGRGVAYVVRSGPGLVVRLRGGGARMVTVPDAEHGAAALGALLAAREPA